MSDMTAWALGMVGTAWAAAFAAYAYFRWGGPR